METEKRAGQRIPLNAEVRIRAAGSSGRGIPCRVRDSSTSGIRFFAEQAVDPGWVWVEVLKSSGRPLDEPLEARIVRTDSDPQGSGQEVGCSFE